MARITFTDTDGSLVWFDPTKAERWEESTRWDGNNNIGRISGADSKFVDDSLYRTKGGRWIHNDDRTRYHNGGDHFEYYTDDQARDWFMINDEDEALARFFGEQPEEAPAPGRPAIAGPEWKFRWPADLAERIDAAADEAGIARAEWIRRAAEAALD